MPRPRIKVALTAASQAILDTAQIQVEAELPAPSQIYDRPSDWLQSNGPEGSGRVLHVRFKATSQANTTWNKLVGKVATLRAGGTVQGLMSYHQCSHDDPVVVSCRDHPSSAYQEVVI